MTLVKCKIWYIIWFFNVFPNLSQNWLKFKKILEIKWFCSNLGAKLVWLVYEWVTFSWKIGICMGLHVLSNSAAAHPYHKAVLEPRVAPAFTITHFCNHCNIKFENKKYVDTLTLFSKNLNQRSLTPRWPLTPCLFRSHVWLYPRIIVSKFHDNSSMYVDTVINFAKYHIHTYYILHTYYRHTTYRMSDHIVSYWTQFRQDKNQTWVPLGPPPPSE